MSRWNAAWLIGLPLLFVFGLVVVAQAPPPSNDYELVRTIVDVLAEIEQNYVRALTPEEKRKLVEDMINGGLERLDPHSQYFNQEELQQFETQSEGQFGGIGVLLIKDPKTGYLKVETPMPGTPAYEAGIQANDLILKVDGHSTRELRLEEARNLIKGKSGTEVVLTILTEGATEPKEYRLKRGTIELHPIMGVRRNPAEPAKWDYLLDRKSGIALVRILAFNEKTVAELKAAVESAQAAGAQALILDLRDNPGGLLTQAVQVADLFLNDGTIVSTGSKRNGGETRIRRSWSAKPGDTIFEPAASHPIAVLINGNSASASEIVANALQDHGRAIIVGERSYGKGSVQKIFPLQHDRAALKLTTEVWLTPKGKNIHRWPDATDDDEWGVRPDPGLEIRMTDAQRRDYLEHLRKLDMIQGKPGLVKPMTPPAEEKPYLDPVLEKAIEILKQRLQERPPQAG